MKPDQIAIGYITRAHGVRGEVRVQFLTDFPEHMYELANVELVSSQIENRATIEGVRLYDAYAILKFHGIDDRNSAEKICGCYLTINQKQVKKLPKDTYYIFEILDMEVYTTEGEYLGRLNNVVPTGSNDIYWVRNDQKGEEIPIPALKKIIKEISLETQKMFVELSPDLRALKVKMKNRDQLDWHKLQGDYKDED